MFSIDSFMKVKPSQNVTVQGSAVGSMGTRFGNVKSSNAVVSTLMDVLLTSQSPQGRHLLETEDLPPPQGFCSDCILEILYFVRGLGGKTPFKPRTSKRSSNIPSWPNA
eukprot:6038797-Amphidinium_carterae.1